MDTQNNILSACECDSCNGTTTNTVKLNFAVGTVSQVSLNYQPGLLSFGYDDEAGAGIAFLGVGSSNKLVTSRILDLSVGADGVVGYNRYNGLTIQHDSFKSYSDEAVLNALADFCKDDSNIKVDVAKKSLKVDVDYTKAIEDVKNEFESDVSSAKTELNNKINAVEEKVLSNTVITQISTKVTNLESSLTDANDNISLHDEAISNAEKNIVELKGKVAANETAIASHVNEYTALNEKASQLATDLDDLDGEVDEVVADVAQNTLEITNLKNKLKDIDSLSDTIAKFESEIAPKIEQFESTIETLATKQYVDTLAQNQDFLDGISDGLNSNFVVKSELNAVAARVSALEKHDHSAFATKQELSALNSDVDKYKENVTNLSTRVSEMNTILAGVVGMDYSNFITKESFEATMATKNAEINELKEAVARLRAQINSSTAGEVDQKSVSDLLNN